MLGLGTMAAGLFAAFQLSDAARRHEAGLWPRLAMTATWISALASAALMFLGGN